MTEFPDTRQTLLAGIQSPENHAAWDDFVVLYRPVIYRLARRRGLQDADAQDLVQNVLVRVAGAIERFEQQPGVRFRHWMRTITANAILSHLIRQPQDRAVGGTGVQDLLGEQSALSAELSTEYMREQFLRATTIVRTEVNDATWQAFELTVIQEVSCERAAVTLGMSIGTIYAARSRIIKRLRDQIARIQGTDS